MVAGQRWIRPTVGPVDRGYSRASQEQDPATGATMTSQDTGGRSPLPPSTPAA
jgi:hypothetical protein